ncbi:hypothetical protein GCM10009557_24990 [Virgisporangium ochraceum]|jgi:CRP-like cAMP-binding protein|uniref:Transcriptional regulator, Crp/Fnr family n=1 Tax=Virgisporangium ochraceum TaxID=65505 RepID=A0A8J3ZWA4_9ACTN|nr:Crp/Fnr family transcriptional regulator [Virgisporangium ochraceum]GIJ70368.1 hypothetical protein Voc01_052850 [Virgisporangium ochraceum]
MEDSGSVNIVDVLSTDQRTALESMGTPLLVPAGQTIFWEGQPSRSVLVIRSGNVKITKKAPDGAEVVLAIRGSTEIMGDEGVLMAENRFATVTAITDVEGLDVEADDLLRFVDDHRLWPLMYRAVVHRRRQADEQALIARADVRSRLARWLLELANEVDGHRNGPGLVIETTLSQHDIASGIGASRDAVALELRKLREQGTISTGRHRITIYDLDELRRISGDN